MISSHWLAAARSFPSPRHQEQYVLLGSSLIRVLRDPFSYICLTSALHLPLHPVEMCAQDLLALLGTVGQGLLPDAHPGRPGGAGWACGCGGSGSMEDGARMAVLQRALTGSITPEALRRVKPARQLAAVLLGLATVLPPTATANSATAPGDSDSSAQSLARWLAAGPLAEIRRRARDELGEDDMRCLAGLMWAAAELVGGEGGRGSQHWQAAGAASAAAPEGGSSSSSSSSDCLPEGEAAGASVLQAAAPGAAAAATSGEQQQQQQQSTPGLAPAPEEPGPGSTCVLDGGWFEDVVSVRMASGMAAGSFLAPDFAACLAALASVGYDPTAPATPGAAGRRAGTEAKAGPAGGGSGPSRAHVLATLAKEVEVQVRASRHGDVPCDYHNHGGLARVTVSPRRSSGDSCVRAVVACDTGTASTCRICLP
jgi:hypothetical protein